MLATTLSGAAMFLSACVAAAPVLAPVTHGVAAGDVTTESAVIWSRTDQPAYMHVLVEGDRNDRSVHAVVKVNADGDYTGKARVRGLKAGREYDYKVWFDTSKTGRPGVDGAAEGHFHTPPAKAFQVHEIVTGPINAGIFPNAAFDLTLGTVSLFRFPTTTPANYGEAKQMFNFGLITIAADGTLVASINGIDGAARYELQLPPH